MPSEAGDAAGDAAGDGANPLVRRSLFVCMAQWAHMIQYLVTVQAVTQLWIDGFGGDFAAMARAQGVVASLKSAATLCASPSVGAFSDAVGRKPLLCMEPLCDLFQRAVTLPTMTWRAQALADSVGGSTAGACHSVWSAALGDMWITDPTALGAWQSRLMLGNLLGSAVVPLLSSVLAAVSLRLPFAVSGLICILNLLFMKVALPETLPPSRRKPFAWKAASPLSFIKLFRSGKRLRLLCTLAVIDNWVAPVAGGHISSPIMAIYQADSLGWGLMQRGRFESGSSALSFPGLFAAPWLMRRLGLEATVRLGIVSSSVALLVNFLGRKSWHLYLAILLGCFRSGGTHALTAMIAAEGATTTDLGQGDLQAQVSNFRSVLGTVSGLTWGWVYGMGSRRGVPGLFFLVGLACTLVQLGLAAAPLAPRGGKK